MTLHGLAEEPVLHYRLHVDLPEPWQVIDLPGLDAALDEAEVSVVQASREQFDLLRSVGRLDPDLVAVISLPLTNEDGGLLAILMASMVATTVDVSEVPSFDDPSFQTRVVSGMSVGDDVEGSFVVATHPVLSDDGNKVCLCTFSSPNVVLEAFLTDGFRSLAAGVRLVVGVADSVSKGGEVAGDG